MDSLRTGGSAMALNGDVVLRGNVFSCNQGFLQLDVWILLLEPIWMKCDPFRRTNC